MPERRYYAVVWDGNLVHDDGWRCEADVVKAFHGHGAVRATGILLVRTHPRGLWERVHPGS